MKFRNFSSDFKSFIRTRFLEKAVFQAISESLADKIDFHNGRPGMDLWKILVLGTLRLNCNWDYDKLHDIANNHLILRQMLGHSSV